MTEAQKAVTEIRAVLIPLESGRLLLPNATVAEVVGYQPPEPVEGGPDWLLGEVEWRQNRIPVVAFERTLGGNPGDAGHRARIVICNTLNGNAERPHIGILADLPAEEGHILLDGVDDVEVADDVGALLEADERTGPDGQQRGEREQHSRRAPDTRCGLLVGHRTNRPIGQQSRHH